MGAALLTAIANRPQRRATPQPADARDVAGLQQLKFTIAGKCNPSIVFGEGAWS
jgi:hypothetical protein